MHSDSLQLLPPGKWGELKLVFKADWPRSISGFMLLETMEYIHRLGLDYGVKILCPYGDVNNGLVAINVKDKYYELIIQCPKDDTTDLENALRTTKLIKWSEQIEVPFAPIHVTECVKRIIKEKNCKINYIINDNTFLLDKDAPLFDVSLPSDFTFKLLTLDYVDHVNSTWPHKYPGSEWYFELLTKAKLGYGLFKRNELIAWCFIKEMGALCHLYTMENYRRRGYGELVLKLISNVLLQDKKYVVAFCVKGNTRAYNLYEKLDFKNVGYVMWTNFSREIGE